jgi:hypothetical protein
MIAYYPVFIQGKPPIYEEKREERKEKRGRKLFSRLFEDATPRPFFINRYRVGGWFALRKVTRTVGADFGRGFRPFFRQPGVFFIG